MQVVEEIASGKFQGACAASSAYRMKGAETVRKGILKYGREDLLPKKVTISTVEKTEENKRLKRRVKDLEKALADSCMKGLLDQSFLGIACERMGVEVEEKKTRHLSIRDSRAKGAQVKGCSLAGLYRLCSITPPRPMT